MYTFASRAYLYPLCTLLLLVTITSCTFPPSLSEGHWNEIAFFAPQLMDTKVKCPTVGFPGAEGFGAMTKGGRGGRVIEVTSLNDEGHGTLREALTAKGPRIVVFRVSGTINLRSRIIIDEPFLTVAGQTAPGGGITLRSESVDTDLLKIEAYEVIIRYLRLRPGPGGQTRGIALGGKNVHHIILDHLSVSWAVDENVTTWYSNHNITIQWSIIAEGLHNSTHQEGPHSKGLILGSEDSYNISIHHNLFAHNDERNPRIKNTGLVDFSNNVVYNYGDSAGWITNDYGEARVNFINNYFIPGPSTQASVYELEIDQLSEHNIAVFISGNIGPNRPNQSLAEFEIVEPDAREFLITKPHLAPRVTTTSAAVAYEQVLATAGATRPMRDAVDQRIVQEVRSGTGRIIDDPSQVGGWPALATGTPPADDDHDGMPNSWETTQGFNPQNPADSRGDADADGYTNVEEYLNGTDPHVAELHNPNNCVFMPIIHR